MCSGAGHTTRLVRGSPTRRSSDQRSVDSSPRLFAASYVLHRLLVPRHPPCALINLATKYVDARVHCAVLKKRVVPVPVVVACLEHSRSFDAGRPPFAKPPATSAGGGRAGGMSFRPIPQDPTACRSGAPPSPPRSCRPSSCPNEASDELRQLVNVPPLSHHRRSYAFGWCLDAVCRPSGRRPAPGAP